MALFQANLINQRRADLLPLPKGEGWGEGERDACCQKCHHELKTVLFPPLRPLRDLFRALFNPE